MPPSGRHEKNEGLFKFLFGVGCVCVAVTSKLILSINQQRYLIENISNILEYHSSGGTAYA